jgi:TonB-dependent receptor
MDPLNQSVTVAPGTTVRRDLSLDGTVVKLAEYVVASSREMAGAAIAINEQRFASNIVNVVSADEFGAVLENNVGDFLKFLPGITIDFIGGAARSVSMGGVPPEYVPITIGGFDLATVSGGGTTRNVDFHTISMNNMARIEAIHSPTPDSPGSALAGSVNMIPRSSFDYARARFSYSTFLMMRDNDRHLFSKTPGPRWVRTRKVHPGFDFSYIQPVNDRFGFTLTGADTKQYTEEERTANTWRGGGSATTALSATAATQYPDTTPDKPYLTDYVVEDGGKHTQRRSLGATVDYRFSTYDRVSLAFEYGLYDSPAESAQHHLPGAARRARQLLADVHARRSRARADDDRSRSRVTTRDGNSCRCSRIGTSARCGAPRPVRRTRRRNSRSAASTRVTSTTSRRCARTSRSTSTTTSTCGPGRSAVFDGTTGAPVDPYNLSTFQLNTGNGTSSRTEDVKRTVYANLARSFDLPVGSLGLKGGLDVRQSHRDTRARTPSYTFTREPASILLDEVFSERTAPYGFPKIQYASTQEAYNYYRDNPGKITTNQVSLFTSEVAGSKLAEEVISSAFLRGDLGLLNRRLKLVGGLRAEQTNIDAEGPLTDPTRNFQRDASGRVLRGSNGAILLIQPAGSSGRRS